MNLRILTPRSQKLEVEAKEVYVPGGLGELGIWPGHTPLISTLQDGVLRYVDGKEHRVVVQSGFLEVLNDQVTVLVGSAECEDELDVERAQAELEQVLKRLRDEKLPTEEHQSLLKRERLLRMRVEVGSAHASVDGTN